MDVIERTEGIFANGAVTGSFSYLFASAASSRTGSSTGESLSEYDSGFDGSSSALNVTENPFDESSFTGEQFQVAGIKGKIIDRARGIIKDTNVDGPNGTRIVQFRYKKQPVLRLDYGPYKGTHSEPRLHLHLPKIYPKKHIPLDPRSFFD